MARKSYSIIPNPEAAFPEYRLLYREEHSVNWLYELLKDGPVRSVDMLEKIKASSYGRRSIGTAVVFLGVIKRRRGMGPGAYWEWEMTTPERWDRQPKRYVVQGVLDEPARPSSAAIPASETIPQGMRLYDIPRPVQRQYEERRAAYHAELDRVTQEAIERAEQRKAMGPKKWTVEEIRAEGEKYGASEELIQQKIEEYRRLGRLQEGEEPPLHSDPAGDPSGTK